MLKSLSPGMKVVAEAMSKPMGIKKKVFLKTKKKPFLFKNKEK